jgi:hypothetical protein
MAQDHASELKSDRIRRVIIFTDSQAALSRIRHNGSGPGQTWASAIMQTQMRSLVRISSWSFGGCLAMQVLLGMKRQINTPRMQ